jgi:hypothetical protein
VVKDGGCYIISSHEAIIAADAAMLMLVLLLFVIKEKDFE